MNLKLSYIIVLVTLSFVSCNNSVDSIEKLTLKWNYAIVNFDLNTLVKLYADQVQYYNDELAPKETVINKKVQFLNLYKDFKQEIKGIEVQQKGKNIYRASFDKYTTYGNMTWKNKSYLEFDFSNGYPLIMKEHDDTAVKTDTHSISGNEEMQSTCLKVLNDAIANSRLPHGNTRLSTKLVSSPAPTHNYFGKNESNNYRFEIPDSDISIEFEPSTKRLLYIESHRTRYFEINSEYRQLLSRCF